MSRPPKDSGSGRRRVLAGLALLLLLLPGGCSKRPPHKVLVIGLDGATFDVIDPLIEQGLLPNLAALQARGTSGVLRTIVPAISPPAWTTATTGVNPGKHNIFDFFHLSKTGSQPLLTSALDRRAHPVWHFLNEDGVRTGIMNIPMTFPPDRVDGFFISGFPFGRATSGYTYPSELEAELGDYPLDLFGEFLPEGQEGRLLSHFRRTFDRHSETAIQLMTEKDWDLFWVVFTGTDKVMHFFWKFADPDHPDHDPVLAQEYGTAIREMFQRADEELGRLVELAGPDTDVIVLSDHGMGPIYLELRLMNWLRDERFLVPPTAGSELWAEAFAPGPFSGLVRVNQSNRDFGGTVRPGPESEEVVDRVIDRLEDLRDPVTGEPFVEEVYRREDIFHGPYTANAPDVLFQERATMFVGRRPNRPGPGQDETFGPTSYTFSGFHRPNGILIAAGPRFDRRAERGYFSILDFVPVLYWLFDSEAPEDLDGAVPEGLVRADSLATRPPRVGERRAVILPADAATVDPNREVLESLGYVE